MIRSFADKETAALFEGRSCRRLPPDILRKAKIKLIYLHAAGHIQDLRLPPGNRLEMLKGGRKGQWSIRINDQWRVCFRWTSDNSAEDVEIVDYH